MGIVSNHVDAADWWLERLMSEDFVVTSVVFPLKVGIFCSVA